MAVRTKEEILEQLKVLIGDEPDNEKITFKVSFDIIINLSFISSKLL